MKRFLSIFSAVILAPLAFFACEHDENIVVKQPTGISVSPDILTISQHEVSALKADITPKDATSNLVIWETSDKDVATVSKFGVVEGINPGTANITVTTSNRKFSATCTVTVLSAETP